ncbi:MAG: hypothetical protein KIT44_12685 [Opitutaceae bacterium]|nr:hypothetical protein [Opitutaceae bacterium]
MATCVASAEGEKDIFGGAMNRELIKNAQNAIVCAMKVDWDATRKQGRGIMFPDGDTKLLPRDLLNQFTSLLLSPTTYPELEEAKDCIPSYHIRVGFEHGAQSIEISFCFGCDILQVHRGTEVISEVDFDTGANALFAILYSVFPEDSTMRFLHERRLAWKGKKSASPTESGH